MRQALLAAAVALSSFFPNQTFASPYITLGGNELAPIGFSLFCLAKPERCEPLADPEPVHLNTGTLRQLIAVNLAVNRAIRPTVEADAVSMTRAWRDDATEGDCKDFALTKRSRLLDLGWPASAVLLAEVITPSGEHHAVIVVRAERGDFVLDNLRQRVVRWDALPYRWVRIMSQENPVYWRKIVQ